jgi:glycosyltransferase involved in cell wall biosynthesis
MHPETMAFGGAILEQILMPRAIRQADRIICVSHSTHNDLVQFEPAMAAKSRVIYEAPCVEPKEGEHTSYQNPYYLFVGTKEPRKNLSRMLMAWSKARTELSEYRLVIAGNTGWSYDIQKEIEKIGVFDSVDNISPSEDRLRQLYANCHAVVLTSLYEGFGLPLVEAMAFGKPVIASNTSSMIEITGDAGLLVDPLNIEELSDQFIRLARDTSLYQTLASRAGERSKMFDWGSAAIETAQVLRQASGLRA